MCIDGKEKKPKNAIFEKAIAEMKRKKERKKEKEREP